MELYDKFGACVINVDASSITNTRKNYRFYAHIDTGRDANA